MKPMPVRSILQGRSCSPAPWIVPARTVALSKHIGRWQPGKDDPNPENRTGEMTWIGIDINTLYIAGLKRQLSFAETHLPIDHS